MATSLELAGISKAFGTTQVLDRVDLAVAPGEFVSLVGASGCGKSTLLRVIAGLEAQDHGQVAIGGAAVDDMGPRARNIAMVFQSYALYPHMSAHDNIALPLTMSRLALAERLPLIRHLSPRRRRILREIGAEVSAVARQLHIEPLLARKPGQLSGGQRQRVALARAMVRQPTLFLMDEPLSNLDAQLRVVMRDELSQLHSRLGATFIYVTHDQVEAMTMSDRVAMMDAGRIAQIGTPTELYDRPATLSVARFIGSPTMNLLPGRIASAEHVDMLGLRIQLSSGLPVGSMVTIGIRPEALQLAPASANAPVVAKVRRFEHHGAERLVFLDAAASNGAPETIIARLASGDPSTRGLTPGSLVALAVDADRVHLFDSDGRRVDVGSGLVTGALGRASTPYAAEQPVRDALTAA